MYRLSRLFRINPIVTAICIVLLCVLFGYISIPTYHCFNALASLESSAFVESGFINGFRSENTYYRDISGLYLLKQDDKIPAMIMMTRDGVEYGGNYFTAMDGKSISDSALNTGECAISKYAAKSNNLQVGDKIIARANFQNYEYVVKYIFDDYYGIDSVDILSFHSLVILGYNQEIVENAHAYEIYYFSDDAVYVTLFKNINIFNKSSVVKRIKGYLQVIFFAGIIASLILWFVIEFLFTPQYKSDLKALCNSCYTKKRLLVYSIVNTLYKYGLIFIPCMVITTLCSLFFGINIGYCLIHQAVCFMTCLILSTVKDCLLIRRIAR